MNTKCQVFTPSDYVEELLNIIRYDSNLYGKRVLENSCGDGNILTVVVKRYIMDCKKNDLSDSQIVDGLERDITGFEIDPILYFACIENLNFVAVQFGLSNINWNIHNEDYLKSKGLQCFDYIVGNPPYITYSEMDEANQVYLRETFLTCEKGKFDYCYAFIEKSISELAPNGKMSYLVPSSIFKTVFGQKLRDMMVPLVSDIVEYTQRDIFDNALVKSAIVLLANNRGINEINYSDGEKSFLIDVRRLEGKWIFSNDVTVGNRFGDYFKVSHVAATLLNKAFVFNDEECLQSESSFEIRGYHIEKKVVRPAETPRSNQFMKKEHIIFPYYYDKNGKLCRYGAKEFETFFPGAVSYLRQYEDELNKRNVDTNAQWFEYGRSQALARLNSEKILISTIVSSEVIPYRLTKECIPYAGMFIVPKEGNQELSLDDAIDILKSEDFFTYVQDVGIHVNGNSVRITSKDIENYKIKERLNGINGISS